MMHKCVDHRWPQSREGGSARVVGQNCQDFHCAAAWIWSLESAQLLPNATASDALSCSPPPPCGLCQHHTTWHLTKPALRDLRVMTIPQPGTAAALVRTATLNDLWLASACMRAAPSRPSSDVCTCRGSSHARARAAWVVPDGPDRVDEASCAAVALRSWPATGDASHGERDLRDTFPPLITRWRVGGPRRRPRPRWIREASPEQQQHVRAA